MSFYRILGLSLNDLQINFMHLVYAKTFLPQWDSPKMKTLTK